jgi:hypothetical protein
MPSNYARGAAFERKVQKHLEERGWTVVRAAGSHSPIDLVAIRHRGTIWLIQCRTTGDLTPTEWNHLKALEAPGVSAAVLCWRPAPGELVFRWLATPKSPGERRLNANLSQEVFP